MVKGHIEISLKFTSLLWFTITHAKLCQFLVSSFAAFWWTDTQTDTRTDSAESNICFAQHGWCTGN